MPFIVQCPHQHCRKYNLLEDDARGKTVECLVCKHHFKVQGTHADSTASSSHGGTPATNSPGVTAHQVISCPNCGTPLRLPPGDNRALRCGRCGRVLTVR